MKTFLVGLTLTLGFILRSVEAESSSALVRSEPAILEVGQGQVETLSLILEDAQEVYGIDVRARFDPAVIEIVDTDPAAEGVQMLPGDFPQPDFLVRNTVDNAAGTLMYVATQVNPTPPANGKGPILSIQFRGKVINRQSAFTIEFVDIVDRQGRQLSVQTQSGAIQVVPPKPATSTPIVPATRTAALTPTPAAVLPSILPTEPLIRGTERDGQNTSSASNTLRLALAGGGCLGVLVLIAVAARVMLRTPSRSTTRRL